MWKKYRRAIYWTVGLFVVVVAGSIGRQVGSELFRPSKTESLNNLVTQAATQLNAQAPKKIDEITTLVRAEASMGSKLTTFYVLENYDSYGKDFSLDAVRLAATKHACSKKDSTGNSALAMGITYAYVYTRRDGSVIGRFEVAQQDCYRTS
ncbi:hypothetical protein LOY64_04365 [Pseudomonas corrugata]|uniref:hypothetical protein n=1 Tax=Pseudomonas corrugata TaxID=47879 RepID=UPI00222FAE0A|nr:hypothetical protein [Pseudomonas corrugata]UZD96247.1 hypothetical protein LOY64_04365 [Pseudomonas corrugata]